MKLSAFASLAVAFVCAMLPLKAATTGTLFTIPAGTSGHATIEIAAPIALDSYSVTIRSNTQGEVAYLNMLRSSPNFDLSWSTWYGKAAPNLNVSVSVSYPDPVGINKIWSVSLENLPPGDYYVEYDGSGPVYSYWPIYSLSEAVSFMEFYFGYGDYTYPPNGSYGYMVWHADSIMSVTATDYGY